LAIELCCQFGFGYQNAKQESLTIQLSIPFIFGHSVILLSGFADVDDTRRGDHMSSPFSLSSFIFLFLLSPIPRFLSPPQSPPSNTPLPPPSAGRRAAPPSPHPSVRGRSRARLRLTGSGAATTVLPILVLLMCATDDGSRGEASSHAHNVAASTAPHTLRSLEVGVGVLTRQPTKGST
jgi:hypothetical protein